MQTLDLKARFDKSDRRIYETPIGNLFSVTSILHETRSERAKEALAKWASKEKEAGRDIKAGAKRGSAVHDLVERYLRGDTDPRVDDIEIMSYFYSLLGVIDSIKNPILIESAIYHPIGYAGRIDCLALNFNDELILYDWKTSKRYIPRQHAATWKEDYLIQVSAYAHALNYLYRDSLQIDKAIVAIAYPYSVANFAMEMKLEQSELDHYFSKFCDRLEKFKSAAQI